ncbi:MAG: sulfatase [Dehalococcoidia bacterium]|nr:sulfatase [Dehalococcoidia bacterium]
MEERPNIILIVIDSLRADHCSCYGYGGRTTPVMDQIAREGVLFEEAIAAAGWTFPSHASIFTGLYPTEHGADADGSVLGTQFPTMAGVLAEAGYATVAFSENPVALGHGLDRGFQEVVDSWHVPPKDLREIAKKLLGDKLFNKVRQIRKELYARRLGGSKLHWGPKTVSDATSWVGKLKQERRSVPFFLFANFCDVHIPYVPPMNVTRRILSSLTTTREGMRALWNMNCSCTMEALGLSENELDILRRLYDGEITFTDSQLGVLIERLGNLGVLENSLLIVTADHGDHQGDHGLIGHGLSLYDSLLRVPLVMRFPGLLKQGQVYSQPVQTPDIFHTVLDAAGLMSKVTQVGSANRSLLGQTPDRRKDGSARATFAESYRNSRYLAIIRKQHPEVDLSRINMHQRCVRMGGYKYIKSHDMSEQFYDLGKDPSENQNLAAQRPPKMAELRYTLDTWHSRLIPAEVPADGHLGDDTPEEVRQRLESLGYLA